MFAEAGLFSGDDGAYSSAKSPKGISVRLEQWILMAHKLKDTIKEKDEEIKKL